jgi:hypothetical protein
MKSFTVVLEVVASETDGYRYNFPCSANNIKEAFDLAREAYPGDIVIEVSCDEVIEYEINFNHWNILLGKHENKYDYFKANSVEQAKAMACWKYGDLIDIVSVEIFS